MATTLTFAGLAIAILAGIGTSAWSIGAVVVLAVVSVADVVKHHVAGPSPARRHRWRVTVTPLLRISREASNR